MRLLVSWLRELVDVPVDVPELWAALQRAGFEVATVEAVPGSDDAADAVIDFEITANRPDCLSVLGFAREVATIYDLPFEPPDSRLRTPADVSEGTRELRVTLEDAERCPRYAAALADVTIAPSPAWLARRLHAAGIRAINNVVDVTNCVLLELGQPMHAFDFRKLARNELVIRCARPGERVRTLDGIDRALAEGMLVIADAERAQAIGGVMGGEASEVSNETHVIALEAAYFAPLSVRRTSKRLGLSTEASHRFERGTDIEMPVTALLRALELLEQIGAGKRRDSIIDCYPTPWTPRSIELVDRHTTRLVGVSVPTAETERILTKLGFSITPQPKSAPSSAEPSAEWLVSAPSWRGDVTREVDLIEEVARIYGYDRIPDTFPTLAEAPPRVVRRLERDHTVRRVLLASGFNECVTFSFIEQSAGALFAGEKDLVPIANPLSEKFAVLRPSILPGLLDSLGHNRRHGRQDVKLFELGSCFSASAGERRMVGLVWTGAASAEHWSRSGRSADFYDVKGACELLGRVLGVPLRFEPAVTAGFDAGTAAAIVASVNDRPSVGLNPGATAEPANGTSLRIGTVGLISAQTTAARETPGTERVYAAEIDLDLLEPFFSLGHDLHVAPLPRQPSVVRDLSIVVDVGLPADQVRGTIRAAAPPTLVSVQEFDRYQGKGVEEGRVSLSLRLTFQDPDRTLTDAEVQEATDKILAALAGAHGARQR